MKILLNDTYSVCHLGKFAITSSKIMFTDPCYGIDTWCTGNLPALNGNFDARIGKFIDDHDKRENERRSIVQSLKDEILGDFSSTEYRVLLGELINGLLYSDNKIYDDYVKSFSEDHMSVVNKIKDRLYEFYKPHEYQKIFHDDKFMSGISSVLLNQYRISQVARLLVLKNQPTKEMIEEAIEFDRHSFDHSANEEPKLLLGRVQFLQIKHESIAEYTPFESDKWVLVDAFDCGVDSGQAGMFDYDWFTEYAKYKSTNEDEWEKIYGELCDLSECDSEKTHPYGVNASTAYGDGSATLFVIKDESGNVIEAVYSYDMEYEEE